MSPTLFGALQRRFATWPDAPSRREALQAALALAGGLLCFERLGADQPRRSAGKIVVIGAGFAGLACADELAAAGYSVTVLEARGRVGGRVFSRTDTIKGKVIEAGGELIGPNQPTWMAYCKRFKLEPVPQNSGDGPILLNGKILKPDEAQAVWKGLKTVMRRLNQYAAPIKPYQPWESPGARELDQRSLGGWLREQHDVDEVVLHALDVQIRNYDGISPGWESFLGNLAVVKGGGLDRYWDETDTLRIKGGAQQLAEKLRESLARRPGGQTLHLNSVIRRVQIKSDRILVKLANGKAIEADDVVLTAPPTTWSKIDFDPPLPPALTVPLAANCKYMMEVEDRFYAPEKKALNALSDGPVPITWEATSGQGDGGPHGFALYAGGATADDWRSWSEADRKQRLAAGLRQLYPDWNGQSLSNHFLDWLSDPWARGTYSFPAPGQVTTVGPLLARAHHQRLHLAGEHCCYAFAGYMEGALNSGVRLARRLAERDGLVKPVTD